MLTKFAEAAVLTLSRMEAAERAEGLRREREEHFHALVTATSDVVYRMSADWMEMHPLDGRTLVASNSEPIHGWMDANLPAFAHARVREAIARAIAHKQIFELEHRVIRPDGSLGCFERRPRARQHLQRALALGAGPDAAARTEGRGERGAGARRASAGGG